MSVSGKREGASARVVEEALNLCSEYEIEGPLRDDIWTLSLNSYLRGLHVARRELFSEQLKAEILIAKGSQIAVCMPKETHNAD